MSTCEFSNLCSFFFYDKMRNLPGTANLFKYNFCESNHLECARFVAFKALGKDKVPDDLYPNMKYRLKQIISVV